MNFVHYEIHQNKLSFIIKTQKKVAILLNRFSVPLLPKPQLLQETFIILEAQQPKSKEAVTGLLLGSALAGTLNHVQAIKRTDEKRIWIVGVVSNLVWAATSFIACVPIATPIAAATAGGISVGAVLSTVVYTALDFPRDFSPHDQQTLPVQLLEMKKYIVHRGWSLAIAIEDVGCGAKLRPEREKIIKYARQRKIDVVVVWKLDRWGRSLPDLFLSLQELNDLNVGFVSITEALDITTASGRALAGMLAVFASFEREVLKDRIKAGIAHRIRLGKPHGRPAKVISYKNEIKSSLLRAYQSVKSQKG